MLARTRKSLLAVLLVAAASGAVGVAPAGTQHLSETIFAGGHSGGGYVEFAVTEDGSAVSYFRTDFHTATCSIAVRLSGPFPIREHRFSSGELQDPTFTGVIQDADNAGGTIRPKKRWCAAEPVTWSATTSGTRGPPWPPAPPSPACHVPNVVGRTLAVARSRIRGAHCALGRVRSARSGRPRNQVLAQSPPAGSTQPGRAKINLVVSRGR